MLEMDRRPLFDAFWNGDADKLSRLVSRILLNTISYHDYKEDFYRAFLTASLWGRVMQSLLTAKADAAEPITLSRISATPVLPSLK